VGIAGMALVYDLVDLANDNKLEKAKSNARTLSLPSDTADNSDVDGSLTVKYLKNTKDIISRISSSHPGSLGLHPIVYVYAGDGRYQISSFMAVVELIKHLEKHVMFEKFTVIRGTFEDFIVNNKIFINQIVAKYGSGARSYKRVFGFFLAVIELLLDKKPEDQLTNALMSGEFFYFKPGEKEVDPQKKKDFSSESKSIVFLREALKNPLRCSLCNGYIYTRGFNIDHIEDKKNGGIGNADNGQLTHFYCNSIKDKGIFSKNF
jgi:hypothetical protein